MIFQIDSLLLLLLCVSIVPIDSVSDTTSLSEFTPKSDNRCGISEYKARTYCGRVCASKSDCNSNEYCWETFPNICYINEILVDSATNELELIAISKPASNASTIIESTTSTPINTTQSSLPVTFPPEYSPRTDFRCGSNEEDSRINCGKLCAYNSDCESDDHCWSTFPNTCYINDPPTASPVEYKPLTDSPGIPVEVTFAPVNTMNLTLALMEPSMEHINVTLNPSSVASPIPDLVVPTIAPMNPNIDSLSATPAPLNVLTESMPRSEFRCGKNEEDSRTNCGKVCVFITDCNIGEHCWSTFPNTCYIDELPVVVPTANSTGSMPLSNSPVTTVPTTLTPATFAPVKASFAPVNTSVQTVSPSTSTLLPNYHVTTAPSILRPITSEPVKATFAPVTLAPVTLAPVTLPPVNLTPVTLAPVTLAPIRTVHPTPVSDIEPISCPYVPSNGCSVCGDGKCVGAPEKIFLFPGQPAVPCGILESKGYGGSIPSPQCSSLKFLIENCECKDSAAPMDLTLAPVNPTPIPIEPTFAQIKPTSAPVNPTLAPIDATVASVNPTPAPVEPTSALVNPTLAPVNPTLAQVNPTPVPVELTSAPLNTTPAPIELNSASVNTTPTPFESTSAPVNPTLTPAPGSLPPAELLPKSDYRCGIDEEDSRINCGKVCNFNSDCESGEHCWSTFPNTCYANSLPHALTQDSFPLYPANLEARSDFRCGTSEADARGNCKRECTTQTDCEIGEYCWDTLPNYCHANLDGRN